jgi:molybdenum cofactor biosynthesis enzyme MoaA
LALPLSANLVHRPFGLDEVVGINAVAGLLRELLRSGGKDDQIAQTVRRAVHEKKAGHGIDTDEFIKPERAMYQIGG